MINHDAEKSQNELDEKKKKREAIEKIMRRREQILKEAEPFKKKMEDMLLNFSAELNTITEKNKQDSDKLMEGFKLFALEMEPRINKVSQAEEGKYIQLTSEVKNCEQRIENLINSTKSNNEQLNDIQLKLEKADHENLELGIKSKEVNKSVNKLQRKMI